MTVHAAGPLGSSIEAGDHLQIPDGNANGQIVLRRVAWVGDHGAIPASEDARRASESLWRWANRHDRLAPRDLLAAVGHRRHAAVERLRGGGCHVEELEVRPVWRSAIGLGDESPQETGMRLHGTYGFPVLPGQSLKGLAVAEGAETSDAGELASVAGAPRPAGEAEASQGQVMFLDALPTKLDLGIDVMTPHVAEYYEQGEPPAEYWQPNPVTFLVLTRESGFRVHVVGRGDEGEIVAGLYAREWLVRGLTRRGLGAKTAAGYGYMAIGGAQ